MRSYAQLRFVHLMRDRPPATPPPDEPEPDAPDSPSPDVRDGPGPPDLSGLPIAGITRRRIGFLVAALLSAWVVIAFARQVGDASSAGVRVEGMRAQNAELANRVAALEREYQLIQRQEWIEQQARGYGLGTTGEIPFTVAAPPSLPPDAPGSAAVRLGGATDRPSPLEAWLSLLFGPSR
jgi:cell division protein FtsB